jgi:hypothetical protein
MVQRPLREARGQVAARAAIEDELARVTAESVGCIGGPSQPRPRVIVRDREGMLGARR